jgi:hypothetical protein
MAVLPAASLFRRASRIVLGSLILPALEKAGHLVEGPPLVPRFKIDGDDPRIQKVREPHDDIIA